MVAVSLVSLNLAHEHTNWYWTGAAEIVRIELHAQPDYVLTTEFHNKVSIVMESTWPELQVSQKFEIQIQIVNHF